MKNIAIVLLMLVVGMTGMAFKNYQGAGTQPKDPVVKFDTKEHDFGVLKYGEMATFTFTFTNISKAPVVIENVERACGCTTPTYSTEPVMPGKTGTVAARYDTTREGHFFKTLTVKVNGQNYLLVIKGDVEPKDSGKSN